MSRETNVRILLVDDDEDSRAIMARALRSAGYQVVEAADGAEALKLGLAGFDVILTDLQMPGVSGREVVAAVRKESPVTPVIVFTAYADAQSALDLMGAGAYDYLPRPVDLTRLRILVQRALERRRLVIENDALRRETQVRPASPGHEPLLVGTSPAMLEVYKVMAQVAATQVPVLIVGDSGTGKELVARTIHQRSGRSGPFLTINCAALPEAVLEGELFGYEPGATPGAAAGRPGLVEEAQGGTLFLDEIDETTPRIQSQVLRVLSERVVRRPGSQVAIPIDVRILTSTSRDLSAEVTSGRFREDLLFRLQVVSVQVPPLSARREDLPLLVDHFIAHYAGILDRPLPTLSADAREALLAYDWPGNVRELAHTIERAIVLARGNVILKDDLPPALGQATSRSNAVTGLDRDWPTLATVERRYIDRVLQHTGGNKTRAAEVLGIDRRTLSRLFARERSAIAALAGGTGNDPSEPND